MIGFNIKQLKSQIIVACSGILILAVVVAATGFRISSNYHALATSCSNLNNCSLVLSSFSSQYGLLQTILNIIAIVMPVAFGMFWGSPIVAKEIESGTFRLAWTQSLSRNKWLSYKLAVVFISGLISSIIVTVLISWWFRPFDIVNANMYEQQYYLVQDVVPVAYVIFAISLGLFLGSIFKRNLPAIAATMVLYIVFILVMGSAIRPNLVSPTVGEYNLDNNTVVGFGSSNSGPLNLFLSAPDLPNSYIYSVVAVNDSGQALSSQTVQSLCPDLFNLANSPPPISGPAARVGRVKKFFSQGDGSPLSNCINAVSIKYHVKVTYLPESKFWPLQWTESGVLALISLVLVALSFLRVNKLR